MIVIVIVIVMIEIVIIEIVMIVIVIVVIVIVMSPRMCPGLCEGCGDRKSPRVRIHGESAWRLGPTRSPPAKSLDFRGFDSSRLLLLRVGNSHVC